MKRVAIVTDSTASIPDEMLAELEIHWVAYYIHRGSEVLRDLVTIQREPFYRWLRETNELPKTACPGTGDYLQVYQQLADEGIEEIASIHMTSKNSGVYQAALVAKEMIAEILPRLHIEIVDTLNVSMCHGWMVIEAARAALAGSSLGEIVTQVQGLIPITRMIQTADTLKYLYMGGRIGRAKHMMGSLLNIKPLISMQDGVIVAQGQARTRMEAYRKIVKLVEQSVGEGGKIKAAYVHAAARDEVLKLKELIEARLLVIETIISELPPSLGVHTGPGTTGLCYYPVSD